ncbi:MAG: hypothetical protein KAQ62_07210, partial [Cyclobacteriaceae bacterium]|nr:hypothetical protein [Cyclobacteriaceae bacterium]
MSVYSQEADTTKTMISTENQSYQFELDSMGKQEYYPLDIGLDRGLFIVTSDGKMQMRILGSVRFLVINDFINFPIKKTFNTYYIPIGEERIKIHNYYGTLNQSRLGLEVTRKLQNDKSVFIRLETDFSGGSTGNFRIRHAYGQLHRFLIGQTWSLFSDVTSLPSTVNFDGPTGSVIKRTPQIRYYGSNMRGTRWAVALEYSRPDVDLQEFDTTGLSTVQFIPDITARIEREGIFGAVQLSGVLTTLSVLDAENNVTNKVGFGGNLSGTIDFVSSKILYQLVYGSAISHFITTYDGTGKDAIYNPETGEVEPVTSFGGFLAYDYRWLTILSTNIAVGYADLTNKDFEPDHAYSSSMSAAINTFWQVNEGAKLGLEYIY